MVNPVVDLAWWQAHRSSTVLADVRWYLTGRSGRDAYDEGHLPGAIFVDVDRQLAAPPSPGGGRHPLPSPAEFAREMARLGISDDDTVVAYDDAGGVMAARLVWMLRVTGHEAALLDGGIGTYQGELETTTPDRPGGTFTPRPWPADRLADIDAAADTENLVIDARDGNRYRGETEPVDAQAGHIPGAVNLPTRENLAPDGRFLPVEELRRRFATVGVTGDVSPIAYCGSGVTACHTLIVLEHAGLRPGRLYAGSWSQYSQAAGRPVATGPGVAPA